MTDAGSACHCWCRLCFSFVLLFWGQRGNQKSSSHQRWKSLLDLMILFYNSWRNRTDRNMGGERTWETRGKRVLNHVLMVPSLTVQALLLLHTFRGRGSHSSSFGSSGTKIGGGRCYLNLCNSETVTWNKSLLPSLPSRLSYSLLTRFVQYEGVPQATARLLLQVPSLFGVRQSQSFPAPSQLFT